MIHRKNAMLGLYL